MRGVQTLRSKQTGLTLVELMVAVVISLIVSMAVFTTLSSSQRQNKQTTAMNSTNQAGAFAAYQLDQLIRNAGTGLLDYTGIMSGISVSSYSCLLHAAQNGQTLLPRASIASPFDTLSGQLRLAPFLIKNGAASKSDIIVLMATGGVLSSMPARFNTSPSPPTLSMTNLLNFKASDKVLLVGESLQPCYVSQVKSDFVASASSNAMTLAGDYYQSTISGEDISNGDQYLVNLGQTPKFLLLGVNESDDHLYQYDLLAAPSSTITNANPNLLIENVYSLQAIYGVDANGDGDLADLTWVAPTGSYDYTALNNDPSMISRIKAVKVALVLRSDVRDAKAVSATSMTIFADTSISQTVTLNDQHYRYQSFETTIPIRNSML